MRDVQPVAVGKTSPFRLPDTIKPCHYNIEIEPDVVHNTVSGKVVIQLDVVKPTRVIAFHALRLDITYVAVNVIDGDVEHPKVQYQPENQVAFLDLKQRLPGDSKVVLTLKYHGEMSAPGSMAGLYATPYQKSDGGVEFGFETMMEATNARSVFPCWDEPALKAEFAVSIVADTSLTCLSNMDPVSEKILHVQQGKPKKRVVFETTPRMSTVLVVMVAGLFNMVETDEFHVPIRIWAPVDKNIKNTSYALDVAVKAMKTHEKNYDLEYPLPKLDMVAIPGHTGGMEHWGCVSYEERGLVLSDNPSEADKLRIAFLVTHELAHQWFGDIVTMEWWDAVWLNEAFADWATFYALSQMMPDFDSWAAFVAGKPDEGGFAGYQDALDLDSSIGTHAILDPNLPPAAAFDTIAYLKGCSIIRMMAEDIGVDVFLQGIRHYLRKHLYGNATTNDLWDALSEVSGRNVAEIMAGWTEIVGYPLLKVDELRPVGKIVISQSRFLQNGDEDREVEPYPVTVHVKGPEGVEKYLLREQSIMVPANLFKYKVNADQVGFYRVTYPLGRIHKFVVQFEGNYLSVQDKIGIISDLGAVVGTGRGSRTFRLSDFLDFLLAIKSHTTNLYVWRAILSQVHKIQAAFLFEGEEVDAALRAFRFELLDDLVKQGYLDLSPEDSRDDIFLKAMVLAMLKDHPKVQNKAWESWQQLLDGNRDALDPNTKKSIFRTVVADDATEETWNLLKSIAYDKAFVHSTDPTTPVEALVALGSTRNPELVSRCLELITPTLIASLTTTDARQRRSPVIMNWWLRNNVLGTLSEHPQGAQASWNWLVDNWDLLVEGHKSTLNGFSFVTAALGGLATPTQLKEVEKFFADRRDESFELVLKQAIDTIRVRSRFVAADKENFLTWARCKGWCQ